MNTLNYPGDVTDILGSGIYGPDMHGAFYRPIAALYDPVTDKTKVKFKSGTALALIQEIQSEATPTTE
jgi:hypothetical protein